MIKVLDVNNAGVQMYKAASKEELIKSTIQNLCQGEQDHNHEDFIAIAEGRTSNSWEGGDETMAGEPLEISLKWTVAPGHEQDFSQVFVTVIDITERKRAEEEISRRARETSALLETSLALTDLDLKTILHDIGNSAKTLFSADGCRIFLMQPDGEFLRCVLALQESTTAFSHLTLKLGEGVTGAVAASGQAEIVNAMENDQRAVQVPGTAEEEEAIMFAPLRERDRTIGVISVRRVGSDRPFQPADLAFLEAFASMAASAVSNARLFEETQRRLSELEALYENGLAVGQLMEPRQIGSRIIETFARHLSWEHVAIRLLKPGTDELVLIAFNQPGLRDENREEAERSLNTMINRVGQGLSGWVVQTGQPVRTGNVLGYPQYVSTSPGIQSGLYMPLRVGDSVIGVICVESEEPDALTAQDERLLATFANQAAIAFENARLYQAAQQEIQERRLIEEELRESQERYQLLIETSPDGIIMASTDGTIRFSNLQMAELFHLGTPSELLETSIVSLLAPEEQARMVERINSRVFEDVSQEGHWLMRKDGSRFFGELRSSALRNEKGEQYAIIAQLRDVTERKQAQEALREERQRFLDLFENSPNPTWLEDFTAVIAWMEELRLQGVEDFQDFLESHLDEYRFGLSLIRVLNVNHAAVISNGARNKQELIDNLHGLLLDKVASHILIHELDMIWQGNTSFGFEISSQRLDGSSITGILRVYIPSNDGKTDYARVIVTSTDITERVEIERKLRASELHYRELADSITDVLFELDHDLRHTHWNKASEMLMGIPAHEAIGKSMYDVFGRSEEQERIGRIYRSVLEENQAKTFETEIVLNGQRIVFEINANPSTRGVSVVARNITERKLSETLIQKRFELMEYSARHSFEEVLQKTIDIVSELTESHIGFLHFIETDQSGIILQAWSTETLRDFCWVEGQSKHYAVEQAGVWADAVRQRRSVLHNDYESLPDRKGLPDGHSKLVREIVIPILRNEKIVAVLAVGNKIQEYTQQDVEIAERFADYAWDITERKQMESVLAEERNQLAKRVEDRTADLSRANANLARALRVKDEFLANMSHELRTPLNAILGLSESLGEQVAGPLNEKQQKYLATINESGHHLLALINDILDLAKIEAGQITLDINKVDVNSVCQASLRMIKQLAHKKEQEVLFEIDEDLGLMWADERRLKQMIVNLLSNAVKFTPEGGRIGLEVRGEPAANKVTITVWDTGIGIHEQDLERLFRPFVQLDSGLAREATGTGLGLALVAQMARMHGGSVHAISKPGEGSRFILQLPWEPVMGGDLAARLRNTGKFRAVDPAVERPTILLIEDTREVVMMLVDYLEMAGYKMVTAQDGIDGLAQAKLTHPDLILMDIQMPRMDGFEATQKLRSDPEFKDIPIIALTALAMPNDRQRCLDAGMDEYMSKPVNLKTLTKTIQKLLSGEADLA
jgi:PAS domain S-box-containing protein